jgi:hypothetical protein
MIKGRPDVSLSSYPQNGRARVSASIAPVE